MMSSKVTVTDLESLWTSIKSLLSAGRWHDAEVTLRAAADATESPEIRLTLGTLYAERGELHAAIHEWTRVVDVAQMSGERELLAAVYHNLAAVYRDQGDYNLARRFQQRSLMWQNDCGPEDLLHLTNDALGSGAYELAESLLDGVDEMAGEDNELSATVHATRGLMCGLQGSPREGIRHLRVAYRQHCAAQADAEAGRDLLNLAALYEQLDRWRVAEKCLETAAKHFQQSGEAWWQSRAEGRCARVRRTRQLRRTPACWN